MSVCGLVSAPERSDGLVLKFDAGRLEVALQFRVVTFLILKKSYYLANHDFANAPVINNWSNFYEIFFYDIFAIH